MLPSVTSLGLGIIFVTPKNVQIIAMVDSSAVSDEQGSIAFISIG